MLKPLAALVFITPLLLAAQQQPSAARTPAPAPAPATDTVPRTDTGAVSDTASVIPLAPSTTARTDTVDRIVAVVGDSALTMTDVMTGVFQRAAQHLVEVPQDAAGQRALGREVLDQLIDEEILVQKAAELKVEVSDQEIKAQVDRRVKQVSGQYPSDAEFRAALRKEGLGSPEEFRRSMTDAFRRQEITRAAFAKLSKDFRPASVTQAEVDSAFERFKPQLEKSPATISFRQIFVAPRPSKAADDRARAKAESLLVVLRKGADFAEIAKRESMDPGSAKQGGELGWYRRGGGFVPEFERVLFAIRPGDISPVIKTMFGYHIIKVDRVRPAQVFGRHILIAPAIDSNDVRVARLRADSVAAMWRAGAKFDSLVATYHDPTEEKGVLKPIVFDSLPAAYREAVASLKPNEISAPFPVAPSNGGPPKYAVVQVATRTNAGEYNTADARERLRGELIYEKQVRALLDGLRKQVYVAIRY